MISWPAKLVTDIARRTCVLYIGAGISANSQSADGQRPLTWEAFLRRCLPKVTSEESKLYAESLLAEHDMLNACEVIINAIGTVDFGEEAKNSFKRPGFQPAEIHKAIYNIDSRFLITPNVDSIYDQHAISMSHGTILIKKYNDNEISNSFRTQDRIILKAHGTVDEPACMVFSRKQYNDARYKYANFYRILDSLALTHTYIFLGCGINDPDIKLTLENNSFWFPGSHHHYFIAAKQSTNDDLKKILKDNCNLETLTYNNDAGDHKFLLESLIDLVSLVEKERAILSDTQNW